MALSAGCVERADVLGPGPPPSSSTLGAGGIGGDGGRGAAGGAGGNTVDPPATNFDLVDAGTDHTCALSDGRLYCWGGNGKGALGLGDGPPRAVPTRVGADDRWVGLATGSRFTVALLEDGSVWGTGENVAGQLGLGDDVGRTVLSAIAAFGPMTAVLGTREHMLALAPGGALWGWGENAEGQLGQDDPFPGEGADRRSPVPIATERVWVHAGGFAGHSCAIDDEGALWCWGRNSSNQLGLGGGAAGQLRTPQRVPGPADWTRIVGSNPHSCGLRNDGSLWCWGDNGSRQLGLGDSVDGVDIPTRVGQDSDWSDVSVSTFHTCGVKTTGSLWCWGRNDEGQLGTADITDRTTPTRIGDDDDWDRVSNGRFHTCATKRDGTAWCTGQNGDGQLGVGDFERRSAFTRVLPSVAP